MDKDIFVNNCHTTYLKAKFWKTFKVADELYSQHKEADHKIVSQTVVFESEKRNKTLVMADDSDILILFLWAASSFKCNVFFRQGKSSHKEGILYTEIYPLAEQLEDVCKDCLHSAYSQVAITLVPFLFKLSIPASRE